MRCGKYRHSGIFAAMGAAGRKARIGRAKHKPQMIQANPKIGPSAVNTRVIFLLFCTFWLCHQGHFTIIAASCEEAGNNIYFRLR